MYKLKYYSLTNEERNELKKEFYQTDFGKSIKKRLDRLFITGLLGFVLGIYLMFDAKETWGYIYAGILIFFSIIFIAGSFKVRISKINTYLVNRKNIRGKNEN